MLPEFISNLLPPALAKFLNSGGLYLIGAAVVAIALWVLYRKLFGGRKPTGEEGLAENLGDYPDPETDWGKKEITVEGTPARLRLVVVAPIGKQAELTPEEVTTYLEQMIRGITDIIRHDRPKIRVWPPQLSHQGFPVMFNRLIKKPQREKEPSEWVILAGRTPVGRRKLLVGMALSTEDPTPIGRLTLDPDQWSNVLRVQKADD